jgi:hypothetical protein
VWDDDEKKRCFMRGLHVEIRRTLITNIFASYDEIVSIAIAVDDLNRQDQEDKKRKRMLGESSGSNIQRLKVVYHPVHRSSCHPPQQQAQQQVIVRPAAVLTYPSQPNTPSVHLRNPRNRQQNISKNRTVIKMGQVHYTRVDVILEGEPAMMGVKDGNRQVRIG